jgi:uncharacterized membrane protein
MNLPPLEFITVLFSFLLIIIYHLQLFFKVRKSPSKTEIGILNQARLKWVESVISDKRDLLAVQTMRNWSMAATFMASTSVLISLGLLNTALRPGVISEISMSLNYIGTLNEALWMFKLVVLLLLFFVSFFCFTLAIRYYNQASITINLPHSPESIFTSEKIALSINSGAIYYKLGVRCYYLAIPVSMWLLGPLWMMASTIILIIVLCRLDCSV